MSEISKLQFQQNVEINKEVSKPKLKKNWYVFYTAPRAEKAVLRELSLRGYEVFLPVTKTLRTWKNRQKRMIDLVLFPSYIFVRTEECQVHKICQTPKVATFIHCGGKPSTVDTKCIEGLKLMLNLDQEITVEPIFTEGEKVRVIHGPLMGYRGVLVRQKSKSRFGIQLKEVSQTVLIDICTSFLEKV